MSTRGLQAPELRRMRGGRRLGSVLSMVLSVIGCLQVRRAVRITETVALLIAVRGVEGRFCRAPPATMPAVDPGSRRRPLRLRQCAASGPAPCPFGEQQIADQPRLELLRRRLRPQVVDLHGIGFEVEQLAVFPLEINAELAAAVDSGLQVDGVGLVAILDDDVVAGGLPRCGGPPGRRRDAPGAGGASGCSAFRTRCATASPGTASGSRPYWRCFCAWWAAGIDVRRRPWATRMHDLLHDFSEFAACGRPLRIIAALTDPASIRTCLEGVGMPALTPGLAPARAPPEPPSRGGSFISCTATIFGHSTYQ